MEEFKKTVKKAMSNLTDFPFKDMPVTNASLVSSVIPCLFTMFSPRFALLYGIWHIFFCLSIILDKGANLNAE